MKLYRFSPIDSQERLIEAIEYIHFACHKLCVDTFGEYLPNAGNIGVFCHYEDEFSYLKGLREQLTQASDNPEQKYFKLHQPIIISAKDGVPETIYTHLYIRKPDSYRAQVGDIDFYLAQEKYNELKQSMLNGEELKGARIFPRSDLDMIEMYNPDVDALAYVSTNAMTEKVKVASVPTNLS